MKYASIKPYDIANGIGVRVSLFVSGCTHECKGCFNYTAWDFNYGQQFTSSAATDILNLVDKPYIHGLSLLGGEPLEPLNQLGLIKFIRDFKKRFPNKTIWCYSGYTWEYITTEMYNTLPYTEELINMFDVLVDGRFIQELYSPKLRFKGSSNQRIIDIKKTIQNNNNIVLWND